MDAGEEMFGESQHPNEQVEVVSTNKALDMLASMMNIRATYHLNIPF